MVTGSSLIRPKKRNLSSDFSPSMLLKSMLIWTMLNLLESGAALNDIHWDWRFEFRLHWSKHAASALRMMFYISDLA